MATFEVGDKVRIISNGDRGNQSDKDIGYEYFIKEIFDCTKEGGSIWYREHEGKPRGVIAECLELVQPSSKFKVGDRVRVKNSGTEWELLSVSFGGLQDWKAIIDKGGYEKGFIWRGVWNIDNLNLELIEESPKTAMEAYIESSNALLTDDINALYKSLNEYRWIPDIDESETINKPKQETIMTKITTFVKNLTLSADEKLLRKYGLHNDCGENTSEAKDAIEENFFNTPENQAYLLTIAQGLEAEANKNK